MKVTFLIGSDELKDKACDKLIMKAVRKGHSLAYRLDERHDEGIERLKPSRIAPELKNVKAKFSAFYNYPVNKIFSRSLQAPWMNRLQPPSLSDSRPLETRFMSSRTFL